MADLVLLMAMLAASEAPGQAQPCRIGVRAIRTRWDGWWALHLRQDHSPGRRQLLQVSSCAGASLTGASCSRQGVAGRDP